MGMYTQLITTVTLKKETPPSVTNVLKYMVALEKPDHEGVPDHPLFETDRWKWMLLTDSAYFPGASTAVFNEERKELSSVSSFKNYGSEIEHFCDWISPWVDDSYRTDPIAISRYEEGSRFTFYFANGDKAYSDKIKD
jgi:hypothetical protein